MEKMKEIKSKEEFLQWAKDVNFCMESKRNHICDLQDVFCRGQDGDMKQLKTWFLDVSPIEKQLLTFSIIKAMGEETAYRFIKAWARRQADICIEENMKEIDDGLKRLNEERWAFAQEKGEIDKKINNQSKIISDLNGKLESKEFTNAQLHKTITHLEQTIDTQRNDLDAAYKAINETDKFKAYLRTVLKENDLKSE